MSRKPQEKTINYLVHTSWLIPTPTSRPSIFHIIMHLKDSPHAWFPNILCFHYPHLLHPPIPGLGWSHGCHALSTKPVDWPINSDKDSFRGSRIHTDGIGRLKLNWTSTASIASSQEFDARVVKSDKQDKWTAAAAICRCRLCGMRVRKRVIYAVCLLRGIRLGKLCTYHFDGKCKK